ncbi:MAG: hypothetical protein ACOYKJ_04580 [Candidatus Howiella sp.]|jgi:hypothetical protein
MSGNFIFASVFEIIVAAFIIWGVFHEESLAAWEDRLFTRIKRIVRSLRRRRRDRRYCAAEHRGPRRRLAS